MSKTIDSLITDAQDNADLWAAISLDDDELRDRGKSNHGQGVSVTRVSEDGDCEMERCADLDDWEPINAANMYPDTQAEFKWF